MRWPTHERHLRAGMVMSTSSSGEVVHGRDHSGRTRSGEARVQVHGVDVAGQIVVTRQLRRRAPLKFLAKQRTCPGRCRSQRRIARLGSGDSGTRAYDEDDVVRLREGLRPRAAQGQAPADQAAHHDCLRSHLAEFGIVSAQQSAGPQAAIVSSHEMQDRRSGRAHAASPSVKRLERDMLIMIGYADLIRASGGV